MSTSVNPQLSVGNGRHALVIGGSMAGLLAARVLVDHFDRVTLIERDPLPEKPELRKGVPQASHVHVLLTQGQRLLEQLFPGLKDELAAAGAPSVSWTADCPLLAMSGWVPRFDSEISTRTCSRTLLEWSVRRRLTAFRNLHLLDASQVIGLLTDANKTRVTGVKIRSRTHPELDSHASDTELSADLVVDASGRNSHTPQWLETLGYTPPKVTIINSFLGYASRWYQPPADRHRDWQAVVLWPKPPENSRSGMIYAVEGGELGSKQNRWVVTLGGVNRDYPPTDEAGFLEFARSLRSPILYEAIKEAQPLSPIYSYRRTENRWCHYEQLSRWPEGFIVLGDAVCAFNPVYGQGMTTAAFGALALDECLTQSKGNLKYLAQRFQKQLAKVNANPWLMATGEDLRWPMTQGAQPNLMTRLMHRYMDQVVTCAAESPEIYKAFLEVIHMLKPPTALFQSRILMQVFRQTLGLQRYKKRPVDERVPKLPSPTVDSLT